MEFPFALVDAFNLGRGFTGNPAAVVVLPPPSSTSGGTTLSPPPPPPHQHISFPSQLCPGGKPLNNEQATAVCQMIAAEMNQSETAFVQEHHKRDDDDVPCFNIRWFTPTSEVPLCVHASLAASHCLVAVVLVGTRCIKGALDLRTINGRVLRVTIDRNSSSYTLRVPNNKPLLVTAESDPYSETVKKAVMKHCQTGGEQQQQQLDILRIFYNKPTKKYLVELDSPSSVARLRVDIPALHAALTRDRVASVTFTAQVVNKEEHQCCWNDAVAVTRHFAPWVGIDEDPVTGAAHTVLTPVFAERLGMGPDEERAFFQAMPGRGGVLRAKVRPDHILLTGRGHTIVSGKLHLAQADLAAKGVMLSSKM